MSSSAMKEFKYDVKLLIQGVKDRPCLWDKNFEVYKDRLERRNAWEEIFSILDPRYELMSAEERRLTGEHIVNKWTNIRDTFVKSLKTRMGKPKRKYMLYDQMKFLINDFNNEHDDADYAEEFSMTYLKEENKDEDDVTVEPTVTQRKRSKRVENIDDSYVPDNESSSYKSRKRARNKDPTPELTPTKSTAKDYESSAEIDFVEVDDSSEQRLMNEDEAFFASLLPTVVKYNEDERLEFRIEILGIMKKINENRKWKFSEDS